MKKPLLLLALSMIFSLNLSACQLKTGPEGSSPAETSAPAQKDEIAEIYAMYKAAGGNLSYEEWLDTIKGEPGKDGTSLRFGQGAPDLSLGRDGDSYLDLLSWDYYVKAGGSWLKQGNLKGEPGAKGDPGPEGKDGKSAYEIYREAHPEYTRTEEEWLDDLVNGRLGDQKKCKVTFDLGYDEQSFIQFVKKGETAERPEDPIRDGYQFLDWVDENEDHWVFNGYPITKDITLYAVWNQQYSQKVLPAAEGRFLTLAGPVFTPDDKEVGWNGDVREADMTAASIADVAEFSTDLADVLMERDLEYLYVYKGVKIGSGQAGWYNRALKDGEVVELDGSFAIKAIEGHIDEESNKFIKEQWISDPKTAHVESLTPETLFYPTWQEETDEKGFAWNMDPVCIGEKGTYNFVVAKIKDVTPSKDVCNYAAGLVRTGNAVFPVPGSDVADPYDPTILPAINGGILTMAGLVFTTNDKEAGWDAAVRDADMKAASLADVAEFSSDLAVKLAGKNLDYLYVYKGVKIGSGLAGWTTKALKDGKVTNFDGSFCIKAIEGHIDEESNRFIKEQWISDPKTAHCESLTPETLFYPTWQEASDAHGFDWSMNPVCIGEKGTYNFVMAKIKGVTPSATSYNYAAGLVRTGNAVFPVPKPNLY